VSGTLSLEVLEVVFRQVLMPTNDQTQKRQDMLTPTIPSHTQTHTRRSLTVTVSRLIAYLLINRAKEFLFSRSAKARNRPV
jgi:hypothetical protein